VLGLWQQHAVKNLRRAPFDLDGREILDLALADFFGVILDVEPGKARLWKALRQRFEARTVLAAHVAPLGAQAGHVEFGLGHACH